MSISISNLIFDGPHKDINKLRDQSGIYIIFHREEGRNSILDVGESKDVKKKFGQYDKKGIWTKYSSKGTLTVAVHYTKNIEDSIRIEIVKKIKHHYQIV